MNEGQKRGEHPLHSSAPSFPPYISLTSPFPLAQGRRGFWVLPLNRELLVELPWGETVEGWGQLWRRGQVAPLLFSPKSLKGRCPTLPCLALPPASPMMVLLHQHF